MLKNWGEVEPSFHIFLPCFPLFAPVHFVLGALCGIHEPLQESHKKPVLIKTGKTRDQRMGWHQTWACPITRLYSTLHLIFFYVYGCDLYILSTMYGLRFGDHSFFLIKIRHLCKVIKYFWSMMTCMKCNMIKSYRDFMLYCQFFWSNLIDDWLCC